MDISSGRARRKKLTKSAANLVQSEFAFDLLAHRRLITARIQRPRKVPDGSRIMGIDLTAGNKATGVAILNGRHVETYSVLSDGDILGLLKRHRPRIVSIDSPLGLPGEVMLLIEKPGSFVLPSMISLAWEFQRTPALIDSMGKTYIARYSPSESNRSASHVHPRVIESYSGAAQDILCIPRKQKESRFASRRT